MSIVIGIMLSYWIGFGTNYISETNSIAWRLPLAIQAVPAIILAIGCIWIPYSPRWLVKQGRDHEALETLAYIRSRPADDELVRLEFLEVKAEAIFEAEIAAIKFPKLVNRRAALQVAQIKDLFSTWPMLKRTVITCLMMFFQQMSGIDAIVFYAPIIFASL